MKDAYQVLYEKETDLTRVRQEIESLKIVASLLDDEPSPGGSGESSEDLGKKPAGSAEEQTSVQPDLKVTGTAGAFSIARRNGFWSSLKRRG
jgi:hypothetical protein